MSEEDRDVLTAMNKEGLFSISKCLNDWKVVMDAPINILLRDLKQACNQILGILGLVVMGE